METLLLFIIVATVTIGSYLLVNLTASYFSNDSSDSYGNYNKRQRENQRFNNFERRIIKKSTQLRNKAF